MLGLIPRYPNALNEPNVSLKYPDIARLRLSTFCLEITDYLGASNASASYGSARASSVIPLYSRVAAAIAVLFDYSCTTAHMPAAIVTKRSTRSRKAIKSAVDPPQSSASSSAASQIFASQSLRSPNGHAAGLTNASVTKSKASKPKRRHDGSESLSVHSFLRIM